MSTTDPPERDATRPPDHVSTLRETDHCVVIARADGDAVAAAGLLAAACHEAGTTVQVCVVRTRAELAERVEAADPDATPLVVGATVEPHESLSGTHLATDAFELCRRLDADPDPTLAAAGVVAAGADPAEVPPEILEPASVDREPGVAIPCADLVDGLAHSTLVHAEFSGDPETTSERLDGLENADEPTAVPSWLALAVAGRDAVPDRAGVAVERALRPYRTQGPFETVGGFADVLSALAREAPGQAVALAFGGGDPDAARSIWRDRSRRVHRAVRDADCSRRSGATVARVEGPVEPTARLLRDYRVEATPVVAVSESAAGIAGTDATAGETLLDASRSVGGSGIERGRTGYATVPDGDREAFLDALEEAV